ncbi:MAG: hypothetical protein ACO34G_03505 [Opitutales bacterium]
MEQIHEISPELCRGYQRKDDGAYSSSMNKRNGLALLLALLAMAICLATTFLLSVFMHTEVAAARLGLRYAGLRWAAQSAALRGLADLQFAAGSDQVHTFRREGPTTWAGRGIFRMELGGQAELAGVRWCWSVEDLSQGFDLAARPMASRQASAWAQSMVARPKLPLALPVMPTEAQARALDVGGAELYGAAGGERLRPWHSWQVRGLLTDARRGGWKLDLSEQASLAQAVGPQIARTLLSPAWKQHPSRGFPAGLVREDGLQIGAIPVLTDLRLSLGFFNSRHDGRHRLRFHGSGVLWNPFTVPLLAGPQGRFFLCEVIGAPEVTITNLDSGAKVAVDLDDCPQEDFGVVRQGPRDRGLWFRVEVADAQTYGMSARGLLPGEVYAFLNPPETAQPQGLARILSRGTWRLDRRSHGAGWRRPDASVFLPGDRIEVAVRFRQRVTIQLRPYVGEPSRDEPIAAYPSSPVVTLRDVPFPDFGFRTTGEDYSREDSAGYVIGERRACLRLRLRPRPQGLFYAGAGQGSCQRHDWDFRLPADASEWSVEPPMLSAMDVVDHDASPLAGPLWDLRVNRHDAAEAGAFASLRWRDLPGWPYLSVGSLRHLESSTGHAWRPWLDRGFFSARPEEAERGVSSHQPFLAQDEMEADACRAPAGGWYVIGPWNVNSSDSLAWEAFLKASTGRWHAEPGGPWDPLSLTGPMFFTRPTGAAQPKWAASLPLDLGDDRLAGLPVEVSAQVQGAQMVRRLEEAHVASWARKIVELQSSCGWPFASLQAFAESGLLERSLREVGLNDVPSAVSPGWPLYLDADDLLEAWAPLLTVRGDTFKVIGKAEGPDGALSCELRVQRVAEEHPSGLLGRKFRIISVQYRNP